MIQNCQNIDVFPAFLSSNIYNLILFTTFTACKLELKSNFLLFFFLDYPRDLNMLYSEFKHLFFTDTINIFFFFFVLLLIGWEWDLRKCQTIERIQNKNFIEKRFILNCTIYWLLQINVCKFYFLIWIDTIKVLYGRSL